MQKTFGICLFVIAATLGSIGSAETLRIGGTGAALGPMARLGDAFQDLHPDTTIEILPSLGSGGGIKATMAGAIDIGLSSRDLNQTGFTGEHKAWKVSHDQRKFREPFFDRSAGACSAFGA